MSEEYARSVSKQVVAQLAEREGFQLAHGNALDALADVLNRFIREIGTYAKDYAEVQGRTDVNVLDLVRHLIDLLQSARFTEVHAVITCDNPSRTRRIEATTLSAAELIGMMSPNCQPVGLQLLHGCVALRTLLADPMQHAEAQLGAECLACHRHMVCMTWASLRRFCWSRSSRSTHQTHSCTACRNSQSAG